MSSPLQRGLGRRLMADLAESPRAAPAPLPASYASSYASTSAPSLALSSTALSALDRLNARMNVDSAQALSPSSAATYFANSAQPATLPSMIALVSKTIVSVFSSCLRNFT